MIMTTMIDYHDDDDDDHEGENIPDQVVISAGLIEKMEATIEAELVAEEEGKIYTAVDLFRLPVSDQ